MIGTFSYADAKNKTESASGMPMIGPGNLPFLGDKRSPMIHGGKFCRAIAAVPELPPTDINDVETIFSR
jgi:hypothetical protein